jgi:hypothetical protein
MAKKAGSATRRTPEEVPGFIGPNDCFVTDNVISSARNLVDGFPLTPINFADLCELIEMAILHDRIVMTIPALHDSAMEGLMDAKIVTSTMFKEATPPNEEDVDVLKPVYTLCLRTLKEGGTFGRGIIDKPDTQKEALEHALVRIQIGLLMLDVDHGHRTVTRGARKYVDEIRTLYKVFTDYADAVFDAAQHFHVHAYAGASELPFAIGKTTSSIPRRLYEELRQLHQERFDRVLVSAGYRSYAIPPFAQIVLSRCKKREDIVPQILRAREEFQKFRTTCTDYALRIRQAAEGGTVKDIVDLQNGLDRGIEVLTKKVKAASVDHRFTYRLWNLLKAASPWGIGSNVLDALKDHDIERQHLRAVNGLMDVWKKLQGASAYEVILRSPLFPNEFEPEEFKAFAGYLQHVRRRFPVGVEHQSPSTSDAN